MKAFAPFVDGGFVPWNGPFIESIDPTSGEAWCRIARCGEEEADRAMHSAHAAFGRWSRCSACERADMLDQLADSIEEGWEELVGPEIRDNGKRVAEIRGQFAALHSWYRYFSDQARRLMPERQDVSVPGVECATHFIPFGVVVAITPWNSPLMILAWKLAPALAAGNSVVVKPSEMASASTLQFASLAHAAGLPPGLLNVVTGYGHEAGDALVRHPLTRKVTFTGSDTSGARVAEAAARRVVPTTLELGGKSPQLVFADCDLGNAVNGILSGIFLSNGQTCVAGSRLIVEASIKDALTEQILDRARRLKMGNPMNPATQIGPLANAPQLEKVCAMIEQAKADGARCLLDGMESTKGRTGFFVGPTVFDHVTRDMRIWRDEVFGPVLAISTFENEEDAVAQANDSAYGLAAGVWTIDPDRAARIADLIEAGTVYLNHYRSVDPGSPIGGVKLSGYGRELGPRAVREFLQGKSVWTGAHAVPDPFP
ncbi:MAG: aldehyde dehydrogenase family protein [Rhodospirillales bacterium]|nr:aldehyde dehydrogenase family protein [Rhodospirillales bacterium]